MGHIMRLIWWRQDIPGNWKRSYLFVLSLDGNKRDVLIFTAVKLPFKRHTASKRSQYGISTVHRPGSITGGPSSIFPSLPSSIQPDWKRKPLSEIFEEDDKNVLQFLAELTNRKQ